MGYSGELILCLVYKPKSARKHEYVELSRDPRLAGKQAKMAVTVTSNDFVISLIITSRLLTSIIDFIFFFCRTDFRECSTLRGEMMSYDTSSRNFVTHS